MKQESLETAIDLIIDTIDKSDIDITDKVELMRNLKEFLTPENYEHDLKILTLQNKNRRK